MFVSMVARTKETWKKTWIKRWKKRWKKRREKHATIVVVSKM